MKEADCKAEYDCAACEHHLCREGVDCFSLAERARGLYCTADAADINITKAAASVEAQGYMRWPRALEIIRFAEAAGFSHLGIAFCVGLAEEARTYEEMLAKRFRVSSICCKNCGLAKSELQLEQIHPDVPHETMCAPLCQADILNQAGTDLNVIIGLCVGHDVLFAKYSNAPVTTLVAKDRVLGHNPVAALYSQYWRKRLLDGDGLAGRTD